MQNPNFSSQNNKFPSTIDIKFDINDHEAQVKDESLNKYQENAYLIGRIFANRTDDNQESSSCSEDSTSENSEDINQINFDNIHDEDMQALWSQLKNMKETFEGKMDEEKVNTKKFLERSTEYANLMGKIKGSMQRANSDDQDMLKECQQYVEGD